VRGLRILLEGRQNKEIENASTTFGLWFDGWGEFVA